LISITPQNTNIIASISQVSIAKTVTESLKFYYTLVSGLRRFHESCILLISVTQQFDVRKEHVHLHTKITKTVGYEAKIYTFHAARETKNTYILARIPDETGPFWLTRCR
jgi:hypothetical protein